MSVDKKWEKVQHFKAVGIMDGPNVHWTPPGRPELTDSTLKYKTPKTVPELNYKQTI